MIAPVAPVAPVAPDGPVDPVVPVGPVGPVAPVNPTDPEGPVGPVVPVAPVAPVAPVGPGVPMTPERVPETRLLNEPVIVAMLGLGNGVRNNHAEDARVGRRRASEDKPNVPVSLTDRPIGRVATVVRREGQAVTSDRNR